MNQINITLRQKIKITPHKDGKLKQTKSCKYGEITKINERRLKMCGNRLFNYKKNEKQFGCDFGSKLTLGHPSLINKSLNWKRANSWGPNFSFFLIECQNRNIS